MNFKGLCCFLLGAATTGVAGFLARKEWVDPTTAWMMGSAGASLCVTVMRQPKMFWPDQDKKAYRSEDETPTDPDVRR